MHWLISFLKVCVRQSKWQYSVISSVQGVLNCYDKQCLALYDILIGNIVNMHCDGKFEQELGSYDVFFGGELLSQCSVFPFLSVHCLVVSLHLFLWTICVSYVIGLVLFASSNRHLGKDRHLQNIWSSFVPRHWFWSFHYHWTTCLVVFTILERPLS